MKAIRLSLAYGDTNPFTAASPNPKSRATGGYHENPPLLEDQKKRGLGRLDHVNVGLLQWILDYQTHAGYSRCNDEQKVESRPVDDDLRYNRAQSGPHKPGYPKHPESSVQAFIRE